MIVAKKYATKFADDLFNQIIDKENIDYLAKLHSETISEVKNEISKLEFADEEEKTKKIIELLFAKINENRSEYSKYETETFIDCLLNIWRTYTSAKNKWLGNRRGGWVEILDGAIIKTKNKKIRLGKARFIAFSIRQKIYLENGNLQIEELPATSENSGKTCPCLADATIHIFNIFVDKIAEISVNEAKEEAEIEKTA